MHTLRANIDIINTRAYMGVCTSGSCRQDVHVYNNYVHLLTLGVLVVIMILVTLIEHDRPNIEE